MAPPGAWKWVANMKDSQRRRARHQDGIAPREASDPGEAPAFHLRETAAHAESSDTRLQVLAVWQLLRSLLAAVRSVAAPEEAVLVRGWCIQALQDLALGSQEVGMPAAEGTPPSGQAAIVTNGVLTARQMEILRRLHDGERPKEIAHAPHIADSTARSHIRDAIERLGAHGAQAAVHEAERRGLLGPRE